MRMECRLSIRVSKLFNQHSYILISEEWVHLSSFFCTLWFKNEPGDWIIQ